MDIIHEAFQLLGIYMIPNGNEPWSVPGLGIYKIPNGFESRDVSMLGKCKIPNGFVPDILPLSGYS